MSRKASASQRPRPRIACCRQEPGSPAASARIHPVLRRSAPSSPSRNRPADAATRSCVNNGRMRAFTSRSDDAHSSNVSSIDAPLIHTLPITREKVRAPHQNCNCSVSKANADLAILKHYMRDDAPSVQVLTARIQAIETQQRSLAAETTDPEEARPDRLTRRLGEYEQIDSERRFAEGSYQLALRAAEQARASADRQRVFIASFVPPGLPEEPLYPQRWRTLGTIALLAFALWGIGGLAVQSMREHLS